MESCFYHPKLKAKFECTACFKKICEIDSYYINEKETLATIISNSKTPSQSAFLFCEQCFISKIKGRIRKQSVASYTIGITILASALALSPLLITAILTTIATFAKILIGLSYVLLFAFAFLFIRKARVERRRIYEMLEDNGISLESKSVNQGNVY